MNKILTFLTAAVSGFLLTTLNVRAAGFTDSDITFYGEVRQVGGAQTVLLQSGTLKMTFVNQSNAANRVTITSELEPTGIGLAKPYSYSVQVPLAYLPEAPRVGEFLAIGAQKTNFKIESITIDGNPATLPDGSKEFYGLSFASRAEQYRLDLIVIGDSTDTDGDKLPDWYEDLYGLNSNLANASADFDNDGWSNLDEFRRGSDPAISNRDPQLATAEIFVPESGEAGCFIQIHDSDSQPSDIEIVLSPVALGGIDVLWDGAAMPDGTLVNLADIQAGRLTMRHSDPTVRELSLPLTWNDGGDDLNGAVLVQVVSPSSEDGNDTVLWLDADTLPTAGERVATWSDRSGNSFDAMQPLAAHQPLVTSFGDHRSIQFDQDGSHLFFQDPAIPAGNHTVLIAYQSEGSATNRQVLMSSNRGFLSLEPTAQAISYPGAPHYQIDGAAVRGYESTLQTSATSIFRRQGTTLQNIFGHSFNGEQIPAESLDPVLPTLGASRVALPVANPIRDSFRGQLHELLVFPTALPEQKLRDVHDYLESKWSGAIIWDLSTHLQPATITAAGPGRHIIRGGHGADNLRGGATDNTLSGGPGVDILTGNSGIDHFVFGSVDTGRDVIVNFDPATDVIDFSALFWGQTGDARNYLSTRLDTNFSGPIPTLDTVLILRRPGATVQEIVLRNVILGGSQLIELIVEGRIRMGALSIPTDVELTLAAGSEDGPVLREDLDQSFTVKLTRSGAGVAGALDLPIGFFQDALGPDFLVEGSSSEEGQRAVVSFERGQVSKQITVRPVPDLETEGVERWKTSILPHFRYGIIGSSAARSVSDESMVTLAVIEADALAAGDQPAIVRITRDGSLTSPLQVALDLEGSAEEGVHINPVPRTISIPAGQASADLLVTTASGWDGAQTRIALLRLVAQTGYQIGNPHEATLYAANTATQAEGSSFDRWLSAATAGEFGTIHDLLQSEGSARLSDYLRAYAFGDSSPEQAQPQAVSFRIVDNRPELSTRLQSDRLDLHWQVQDSSSATEWNDVGASFTEEVTAQGLRFLGPQLDAADSTKLYRLSFGVESTSGIEAGVAGLSDSSQYGIRGPSNWEVDPSTGKLTASGGTSGAGSRLIIAVNASTLLDFEMSVKDGDGSDSLAFFIDGVQVSQTSGAPVRINQTLEAPETRILMWEFTPSTGTAVITQGGN
jgi:hypothetical protein